MGGRNKAVPKISLLIWKKSEDRDTSWSGKLWYADRTEIEGEIEKSSWSRKEINQRLGVGGLATLDEIRNGRPVSGWAIAHFEWAIGPDDPTKSHGSYSIPFSKPTA